MSVRRRIATVVFLGSLGTSALIAQQKNPFADWEDLQKQSASVGDRGAVDLSELPADPLSDPDAVETPGSGTRGTRASVGSEDGAELFRQLPASRKGPSVSQQRAKTSQSPGNSKQTAALPAVGPSGTRTGIKSAPAVPLTETDVQSAEYETASPDKAEIVPVTGTRGQSGSAGSANPFADLGSQNAEDDESRGIPSDFSDDESEVAEPLSKKYQPPAGDATDTESFASDDLKQTLGEDAPTADSDASESESSASEQAFDPSAESLSVAASELPSSAAMTSEVGPQSPGVTLQWVRHGDMNVDQPCDVELVVQNTSRSMIRSVMAEAVIPEGVEVVSVSPKPLAGSSMPSWTFGELKPGEKRSVSLKVVPKQRGDVQLDAFVRLTGFSSSTFSVQEPRIDIAVEGPEQMSVGQQGTYIVRVNNPGTGMASNVLIQAAVPEGLEHRRGSLLTIEIGTLNPGESRQAQLNVTAVKGGSHQMAVRALADGGLSAQTAATMDIAEPQLSLQISGPEVQMSGRTEKYVLQVSNSGDVASANVRAKYRVPEGFEFVDADRGGKYSDVDRSIEWFVGNLQGGGNSEFVVTLRAMETGTLKHQAGVISEHGKVTMSEHETTVEGIAVLDLKISASQRQLKVGQEITYEIELVNTGSRSASGVGFSCELPSGLELRETAGPTDYIAENGVVVFKSLPEIEPGKRAQYTVTVRCTREGTHRLRLRAASESISEPLIGEETTLATAR